MIWRIEIKDLPRGPASDKVLRDKTFEIATNPKYDRYQCGLASVVYKFFDKKARDTSIHIATGISENQELTNELHKSITRKFQKRHVYSSYQGYIWVADLADIKLTSKYNKGARFLLYVIDIYSKY